MAKRRISQNVITDIGRERMSRLMDLAEIAVREGKVDRARRYIELSRRIGGKCRVPMPKGRPYCSGCLVPLIPGVNCRVRVHRHMVRTTCGCCGEIARRPYIKEQSHERERRQEGIDEARQRP